MEHFITATLNKAGAAVMEHFEHVGIKATKADASDVVSQADEASSKIIVESIKRDFPDHGIVDEEAGTYQDDAEYVWYSDPLDGTFNFVRQTPLFGVMLCVNRNKKVEAAGILDPVHQKFVYAEKGKGTFLNGQKITCSDTRSWLHSYGCASSRLTPERAAFLKNLIEESTKGVFWMSLLGSTAISSMYVSRGSRDWYCSTGSNSWDYAAGTLVMKEAGCVVTNIQGEDWSIGDKEVVVANKYLHPKLLEIARG